MIAIHSPCVPYAINAYIPKRVLHKIVNTMSVYHAVMYSMEMRVSCNYVYFYSNPAWSDRSEHSIRTLKIKIKKP